jgi:hypothetical protein
LIFADGLIEIAADAIVLGRSSTHAGKGQGVEKTLSYDVTFAIDPV